MKNTHFLKVAIFTSAIIGCVDSQPHGGVMSSQAVQTAKTNLAWAKTLSEGNEGQAISILQPMASHGDAEAQRWLGIIYESGGSVEIDMAQSLMWFRMAANHGDAVAQVVLGADYLHGKGVPQNNTLAYMWFDLAASQGDITGIEERDALAKHLAPAQIAEARRLAGEKVFAPGKP